MTEPPSTKDEGVLRPFSLEQMRFKMVVVMSAGVMYRGMLIGADDSDLFIKGRLRWLILPLDRVTSIRLEDERETFDSHKSVPANFYDENKDSQ